MKYSTITSFVLWVAWCEERGMDYTTSTVLAALVTGRSISEAGRWIKEPAHNLPSEIKLLDIYANSPEQMRMDIFGSLEAEAKNVGGEIVRAEGLSCLSTDEVEKLYIATHKKVKFLVDRRGVIQSHMAEALNVGKHVINRLYSGLMVKRDLLQISKKLEEINWDDKRYMARIYTSSTGRRRVYREEDCKNPTISELHEMIDAAGMSMAKASVMLGGDRMLLRRCIRGARDGRKTAIEKLEKLVKNLRKILKNNEKQS